MEKPYIEKLRIEGYGCIKDVELKLTRLHALIGPNDSGKSTVLRALRTLSFLATSNGPGSSAENRALSEIAGQQSRTAPVSFAVSSRGSVWKVKFERGVLHLTIGRTVTRLSRQRWARI